MLTLPKALVALTVPKTQAAQAAPAAPAAGGMHIMYQRPNIMIGLIKNADILLMPYSHH
jgi:hypothetical protein